MAVSFVVPPWFRKVYNIFGGQEVHFYHRRTSVKFRIYSHARRRGRRGKKLLGDLKDRRGYSHLKGEALDRTVWRNRFGRGFGPVVRQTTE